MFWEACQPQLAECGSVHLPVFLKPHFLGSMFGCSWIFPAEGEEKVEDWKNGSHALFVLGEFLSSFRVLSLQLSDIGVNVYSPVLLGDDPPPSRHFWNKWFSGLSLLMGWHVSSLEGKTPSPIICDMKHLLLRVASTMCWAVEFGLLLATTHRKEFHVHFRPLSLKVEVSKNNIAGSFCQK